MSDQPRVSFPIRIVYCVLLLLSFLWFRPQARAVSFSVSLFPLVCFFVFLLFFFTFFPHPGSLFICFFLYLFISCPVFPAFSLLFSLFFFLSVCPSVFPLAPESFPSWHCFPDGSPECLCYCRPLDGLTETTSPYEGPRRRRTAHSRADAKPLDIQPAVEVYGDA